VSDDRHRLAAPEHRLERLVFFSDAVFAIAITLLVIEIHAPHLPFAATPQAHLAALQHLYPEFFGFVVSFFVVGAFWAGHHRAFALAEHWHDRLILANLTMLLAIAAMPFFTAYLSANAGARVPVLLYAGWMLAAALLNMHLQRIVTTPPVVSEAASSDAVRMVRIRGAAVVAGAATALVACAVAPWPATGLMALMTMPFWRRLFGR